MRKVTQCSRLRQIALPIIALVVMVIYSMELITLLEYAKVGYPEPFKILFRIFAIAGLFYYLLNKLNAYSYR